jgi:hypothetical protein
MTIKALYPTVRPTLNLDFAKTKVLDPRITFTRASTATFVGSNGLIQTAASGVSRFDHNPSTGESLGLLVEEARTNLLLQSSDLTTASWGLTNVTRTANSTTAPDGTNTAVKIASTTGTWQTFLSQASVGISAVATTFSCYAKAAEASWFCMSGIQYGEAIAYFNLATGALGTRSAGSAHSITPVGNGWYRCSVTCASAASTQWGFFPSLTDATLTPAPIGDGVHVWGPQLEAGAFPTSYIPTTTATVTRAADVVSMTGTNFSSWYNQDQGTLLSSSRRIASNSTSSAVIGGSNPNATSSIWLMLISNGNVQAYSSGGGSIVEGSVGTGLKKYAGAYATNNFGASINGSVNATDTSNTTVVCDRFYFGGIHPTNTVNAVYARLAYYPVRLPDAQLQALTL